MLNGIGRYAVVATKSGDKKVMLKANSPSPLANTVAGSTTARQITGDYHKSLLMDILPVDYSGNTQPNTEISMRMLYRDMYAFDPVSGSAVDLISELPFSDFTLSGLPNQEMLREYGKALESISVKTLLPEASRDFLVNGAFLAYINQDRQTDNYNSVMPQDLDYATLTPIPIYGQDPIIDIKVPDNIKSIINNKDPRMMEILQEFGDELLGAAHKKHIRLDPKRTIYIARRTFSTSLYGTSYLRRALPVWLIEKAIMRGTIDLSYRRQKSILHILAGNGDDWEPTNAELSNIVDMFLQADRDPTGAVIATRPDIQTNEIREPTSFWRYDESFDTFSSIKYKALGISDAFLDPSATLNTMENSLSTFLEQIRAFRDLISRKLFYQKLFPLIALEKDFRIESFDRKKEKVTGSAFDDIDELKYVISANSSIMMLGNDRFDPTQYFMPKLQWHKTLKPEADSEYMNILATLEEKGLPIPLRLWAAAGGQSVVEILSSFEEDIKLRKKVDEYRKKLPRPPQEEASQLFATSTLPLERKNRSFDKQETRDPDTRKVLSRKGEKVIAERQNRIMATALANIARKENHKAKNNQNPQNRIYHYSKSKLFGHME